MMKTPKETYVLIAFEKPTAIWDLKMEDVPQLAVQDLKTTYSKKIKQHSAHCNNLFDCCNVRCVVLFFSNMLF